jgi:uncharacterized protein
MTKRNSRLAMAFVFAALLLVANAIQTWDTGLEKLNPASEIQVLTQQAEQGVAEAQHNLGMRYVQGKGVPQDYKQAVTWFQLAAKQGVAEAQYNLGLMYDQGEGVPQDYKQAVTWFQLAAKQGHVKTQNHLGWMYANGEGVPQDYRQAVTWFNIAVANGIKEAKDIRDLVADKLDSETLSKAQDLARADYKKYQ